MEMDTFVQDFYNNHDNYQVIDNPQATEPDLAVIYFSSIGLYTEKNCYSRLNDDYYEFHRNPAKRAGRHIYVRDVTRAVYLSGISAKHNTIEKLLDLLEKLTKGYKVVTVGVSGGGYIAMLAGTRLKAEYVLSISGVVRLTHVQEYFDALPDWVGSKTPDKAHWFNIVDDIKDCRADIIQFEAGRNFHDIQNIEMMKAIPATKTISVDYLHHAGEVDPPAIGELINMNHQQLLDLYNRFKGKNISKFTLNWRVMPLKVFIKFYLKTIRKNFIKLKFSSKGSLVVFLGIPLWNSTGNPE